LRQENWLVHQKQHDCRPFPLTFLFSRLKIKLKGRHFDTIDVVDAENMAVLKTLIEHEFQDTFKIWKNL
jgi:hypothetical protein